MISRARLEPFVKLVLLSAGTLLLMTMCANFQPTFGDADNAFRNENYVQAKVHLKKVLAGSQLSKETRIIALRKLCYAHGYLMEYDSLNAIADSLLRYDANSARDTRLMRETFALKEYNSAVQLFDGFFFDKALVKFRTSIDIVGKSAPYQEFTAIVLRNMAYTAAGMGNNDRAADFLSEASQLGDWLSKSILELLQKQQKWDKPEKLEEYPKSRITET